MSLKLFIYLAFLTANLVNLLLLLKSSSILQQEMAHKAVPNFEVLGVLSVCLKYNVMQLNNSQRELSMLIVGIYLTTEA